MAAEAGVAGARPGEPDVARAPLPRGVWVAAGAAVAVLAAFGGGYGYHRDELYFLEAGRHPAFGYPDQPPLVPLLAAAVDVLGRGDLSGVPPGPGAGDRRRRGARGADVARAGRLEGRPGRHGGGPGRLRDRRGRRAPVLDDDLRPGVHRRVPPAPDPRGLGTRAPRQVGGPRRGDGGRPRGQDAARDRARVLRGGPGRRRSPLGAAPARSLDRGRPGAARRGARPGLAGRARLAPARTGTGHRRRLVGHEREPRARRPAATAARPGRCWRCPSSWGS